MPIAAVVSALFSALRLREAGHHRRDAVGDADGEQGDTTGPNPGSSSHCVADT